MRFAELVILGACMGLGLAGPVLDNFPITFQLRGGTTYNPDAGGIARSGYKLRLGYTNKQWLGVQIVTGTTKNDVLILEIDDFYSVSSNVLRTGHEVRATDFYRTGDSLNYDQNTEYDISTYNYVEEKDYFIDLIRYVGSNSNEDWNGAANKYSLMNVCFYTSDKTFSLADWQDGMKVCYYFEIDGYVSSFKGKKLKDFYLNGYQTGIYGWIDGPYVNANVYFYHNTPLYSYSEDPTLAIELGTTANKKWQDYNVFSPIASETGDYYGKSVTDMQKDTTQSGGYENGGLTLKNWNTNPATPTAGYAYTTVRATYTRDISTFDSYDRPLLSTFIFCLYLFAEGTLNSQQTSEACEIVELSVVYPQMEMPTQSAPFLLFIWGFLLLVLLAIL